MSRIAIRTAALCMGVAAFVSSHATAAVHIECIDTGTPSDGTRGMTGWHGVIVRAVSDGGPITRVDLGSDIGLARLTGVVAQRWLDPTGQGDFSAGSPTVVRTPGFSNAKNASPSVDNFDSHLLGDASQFVVTTLPGENNAYFSPAANGFYQRTGIPSDGFVGYGASTNRPTLDQLSWSNGRLWGAYDVLPPFQSTTLDLAYLVTDSGFSASAFITTDGQTMGVPGGFVVPEPFLATLWVSGTWLACRRRRMDSARWFEGLEARRCHTVSSSGTLPLALSASPLSGGGIQVAWEPIALPSTAQIKLYRKAPGDFIWPTTPLLTSAYNSTFVNDSSAVTGVAYEYKVTVSGSGVTSDEKYILAGNAAAFEDAARTVLIVVDESQLDDTRDNAATTLRPALELYKRDLVLEGYQVREITAPRVDVPRSGPPAGSTQAQVTAYFAPWSDEVFDLKSRIRAEWIADPTIQSVVLIGHVAVPYSGMSFPDGHGNHDGAWAADAFYGTLEVEDSVWKDTQAGPTMYYDPFSNSLQPVLELTINRVGDGKFDTDRLDQLDADPVASGIQSVYADVAIGRIDFSMLPAFAGVSGSASTAAAVGETNLLSMYFAKNHQWRTGGRQVRQKALFIEGYDFDEEYDGNRLAPNVGAGNIEGSVVSNNDSVPWLSPLERPGGVGERPVVLFSQNPNTDLYTDTNTQNYALHNDSWLWFYGGGSGAFDSIRPSYGQMLHSDQYANGIYSSTVDPTPAVARPGVPRIDYGEHKAVFNFLFGSYVADWDHPDSLLRSAIAEPDGYGLVAMAGNRPDVNQHRMALGRTIGESVLTSINNFGARQAYAADSYGSSNVRTAILGDPTLRQDNLKPATSLTLATTQAGDGYGAQFDLKSVLHWSASTESGVAGYEVFWSESAEGPFVLVPDGDLDSNSRVENTTFTDLHYDSAQPNQTVRVGGYYMVRASKLTTTPSGTYWNLSPGVTVAAPVSRGRFFWNDASQNVAIYLTVPGSAEATTTSFALTGEPWNSTSQAFDPLATLANGVDYEGYRFVTMDPGNAPVGDVVTFSIIGTSEMGVQNVIPSGRHKLVISLANATYEYRFVYASGDVNNDGIVGIDDLFVWSDNVGWSSNMPNNPLDFGSNSFGIGDFDNDGDIDNDDYNILAYNYGYDLNF